MSAAKRYYWALVKQSQTRGQAQAATFPEYFVSGLMDMLRHDVAQVMGNAPGGYWLLKAEQPFTVERWRSFGLVLYTPGTGAVPEPQKATHYPGSWPPQVSRGEVTPEPVPEPEPTRFVVCHAGYNYKVGSKVHKALRHTMSASCGAWPVGVLGDDTQEVRDRFPASMKCKKCWPLDQCRQVEVKS